MEPFGQAFGEPGVRGPAQVSPHEHAFDACSLHGHILRLALGETDQALALLSNAYEAYPSFVPFMNVDARLDEVRADRRFQELVERVKLPAIV